MEIAHLVPPAQHLPLEPVDPPHEPAINIENLDIFLQQEFPEDILMDDVELAGQDPTF